MKWPSVDNVNLTSAKQVFPAFVHHSSSIICFRVSGPNPYNNLAKQLVTGNTSYKYFDLASFGAAYGK